MADGFNTDDMLDMYLLENQQLLEKLQNIVLEQKEEDCFDADAINEIFRIMHTMKASSGFMMFDAITIAAHKLEDIFFVLREHHPKNVPHLELIGHVLDVADFIALCVADGIPDSVFVQFYADDSVYVVAGNHADSTDAAVSIDDVFFAG